MPAFELGGRRINYEVIRGNSRRFTYFRFRPDLTLEVVLPRGRSGDPTSVIRARAEWIAEKYDEMSRTKRILDDERVMFDGKFLDIVYEEAADKEEILPDLEHGVVRVRSSDRGRVTELVRRWFLKESSKYVVRMLAEISPGLSKPVKAADVREIKNWGYCTRRGRLSFSWQLIALPERLRDYVVFHEVAHLDHFDHSAAFKRRLAQLCPDFRQREKELDYISPAELSYF